MLRSSSTASIQATQVPRVGVAQRTMRRRRDRHAALTRCCVTHNRRVDCIRGILKQDFQLAMGAARVLQRYLALDQHRGSSGVSSLPGLDA